MEILNSYAEELLREHASAALVLDTNLLVLLMVGRTRRQLIRNHDRTTNFTEEDYDTLEKVVQRFQVLATTPNVLTEASNLCRFAGDDHSNYLAAIINHVTLIAEEFVPSRDVISTSAFAQFGLSDAVLTEVASRKFLVLTSDGRLYQFLAGLGLPTLNFNHIRIDYWT